MKPSGSAARKKIRSSASSTGPAQPKITARGALMPPDTLSWPHEDAADATPLQLAAKPLGGGAVGDGTRLDAIVDAALAEIGARPGGRQAAKKIIVGLPQLAPFLARRFLAAQGAELKAITGTADGTGWYRRRRGGGNWSGRLRHTRYRRRCDSDVAGRRRREGHGHRCRCRRRRWHFGRRRRAR